MCTRYDEINKPPNERLQTLKQLTEAIKEKHEVEKLKQTTIEYVQLLYASGKLKSKNSTK